MHSEEQEFLFGASHRDVEDPRFLFPERLLLSPLQELTDDALAAGVRRLVEPAQANPVAVDPDPAGETILRRDPPVELWNDDDGKLEPFRLVHREDPYAATLASCRRHRFHCVGFVQEVDPSEEPMQGRPSLGLVCACEPEEPFQTGPLARSFP